MINKKSTLSDLLIIWSDSTKEISDYREILNDTVCNAADCSLCNADTCSIDYLQLMIDAKTAYRDKLEAVINDVLANGEYAVSDVVQWIDGSVYINNDTIIGYLFDTDRVPEEWKSETCYYLTTSSENVPTLETCNEDW